MKGILVLFTVFFVSIEMLNAQGWQELGTGNHALNANSTIGALCADNGVIYAAGGFTDSLTDTSGTSYVAKWNGTSWNILGNEICMLNAFGQIRSICVDGQHNVYVAAAFRDTGISYKVMKWDGAHWNELGVGANALHAISSINSICTDNAGNIYAAGSFTDSPSYMKGYSYVAKWNGTAWSELGTGSNALNANYDIMSIVADRSGNIYAAGGFRHIPGGYCYVAKWDGTTWAELGPGVNSLNANHTIWTLHSDTSGNIYAGGFFTAGGSSDYYVAKWNGETWSELGTGSNRLNINEAIFSITTDIAGNVYAAGDFTDSNGKAYVTKWDGTSWSKLGNGRNGLNANGQIFSICSDLAGNIYAGGDFSDGATYGNGHRYVAFYDHRYEVISVMNKNYNKINVYPNPANNIINIRVSDDFICRKYSLIDGAGKIVHSGTLLKNITFIDLGQMPTGSYLLQVENYSGTAIKIIKE